MVGVTRCNLNIGASVIRRNAFSPDKGLSGENWRGGARTGHSDFFIFHDGHNTSLTLRHFPFNLSNVTRFLARATRGKT